MIHMLRVKDSVNLSNQITERFKRSVYYNSYEKKPAKLLEKGKNIYELINTSFQDIRSDYLFVLMLLMPVLQIMKQV